MNTECSELNLDSLDEAMLSLRIKEKFLIDLSELEISKLSKVGDLVATINERKA